MWETIFHGSLAFFCMSCMQRCCLSLFQDILLYGEQSWNIERVFPSRVGKVCSVPIIKVLDFFKLGAPLLRNTPLCVQVLSGLHCITPWELELEESVQENVDTLAAVSNKVLSL